MEVCCDLAGILAISLERKKPSGGGRGCAQFEMVAGARNQRYLRLFDRGIPRLAA